MAAVQDIKMDSFEDLAAYRVKRLARQADMMLKMTTKPLDSDVDALFRNYASVLTVSALIGYATGSFIKDFGMGKKQPMGESVQRQFFQQDQLRLIDLLAYAHTKEPTIIRRTQKYDIFSAYAAAGFDVLCERLDAAHRDWTNTHDVVACGKLLAEWYLKGAESLSVLNDIQEISL